MHWAVPVSMWQVPDGAHLPPPTQPELPKDTMTVIREHLRETSTQISPSDEAESDPSGGVDNDETNAKYMSYMRNTEVPCSDGKCIGILDSGSNIIAGPTPVMKALAAKLDVKMDCSNFETLPTISFMFGGKNVTIAKEGYVMKMRYPKWAAEQVASGMDGEDAGLMEQGERQQSHTGWEVVFEELRRTRGIDLTMHVRSDPITIGDNATMARQTKTEFMCMPALVPMDRQTAMGPLYIVGTPLLETHYARWSWPKDKPSPQIFIQSLALSETCERASQARQA